MTSAALRVLRERQPALATGLGWVPPAVLRALTWDRGIELESEMLLNVVSAIDCDLAFVDAGHSWASDASERLRGQGVAVAWTITGVVGRVAHRRGLRDVIKASAGDPNSLADDMDASVLDMLGCVNDGLAAGAEVIVIADDLAGHSGWLVAPDFAMEALVPRYARVAAAAATAEAVPVFHSDGDIRVLYPALASAGFAGVHLGGAGREEVAAAFPLAGREGLALLGGIRAASIPGEGARHLGEGLASLAASGPIVICDDGGVSLPAEIAAIASVLDAARQTWDRDQQEWYER